MTTDIDIKRQLYDHKTFEKKFSIKHHEKICLTDEKSGCGGGTVTNRNEKKQNIFLQSFYRHLVVVSKFFLLFQWAYGYDIKNSLIKDILSGVTVGVTSIPQGLAYGALTSLAPIYGLYTLFVPGLIYTIFATSKHLSVGTFAIIAFMVLTSVQTHEHKYKQMHLMETQMLNGNSTGNSTTTTTKSDLALRLEIATSLALFTGLVQILLSFLRFGSIFKYLSNSLLRGFTTAAALQVIIIQSQHLTGIYLKSDCCSAHQRYFKLIKTLIGVCSNIETINWAAFVISSCGIIAILLVRFQISERFKTQMRNIPFPTELLLMVIIIFIIHSTQLDEKYGLRIVGRIETSLPKLVVPKFSLFFMLLPDAIFIAVVSFTTSISIANFYSNKHKYKVDSNKELFALGMSNFGGSFFQCFASCGALARSAIFESSGGSSQIVSVVSCGIILCVILWIAPLFEKLPMACLSAIIVSALFNLLKQLTDIGHYWKTNRYDLITWLSTFTCTLLIGVEYGLFLGLLVQLIVNTYRNQTPKIVILGQVENSEIYADVHSYCCKEIQNYKIVKFYGDLFYMNTGYFIKSVKNLCRLKGNKNKKKSNIAEETTVEDEQKVFCSCLIIDFSSINYIDEMAVECLKNVIKDFNAASIKVKLANCNDDHIEIMKSLGVYKDIFQEIIYVSVHDAVTAVNRLKE